MEGKLIKSGTVTVEGKIEATSDGKYVGTLLDFPEVLVIGNSYNDCLHKLQEEHTRQKLL